MMSHENCSYVTRHVPSPRFPTQRIRDRSDFNTINQFFVCFIFESFLQWFEYIRLLKKATTARKGTKVFPKWVKKDL